MWISRPEFLAVFVAMTAMSFGTSVISPLLGTMRAEFGVSYAVLGLLPSMPTLARVVANLPSGLLADRFPARVSVSGGALAMLLGSLVVLAAPNFGVVLAGLFLAGSGTALTWTGGITDITRRSPQGTRGKVTTRMLAGVQLGSFLSPVAGGLLASAFGWRAAFILTAATGAVVAALAWAVLRAPAHATTGSHTERARRPSLASVSLTATVLTVVALSVLVWGGTFGMKNVLVPLYVSEALQLDPRGVGLMVSIAAGLRVVVMFLSGNVLDRIGRGRALVFATLTSAAGALTLLAPPHLALYGLFAGLYALGGLATALPPLLIADRVPSERLGRSMAGMQFLTDLVLMGVPPLLGLILDRSGFGLAGIATAAAFVAAALVGPSIVRPRPLPTPRPVHADDGESSRGGFPQAKARGGSVTAIPSVLEPPVPPPSAG